MDDETEFEFDALPRERARDDAAAGGEWEPDYEGAGPQIDANDPLTATLSDLDLAPARARVLEHAEYDDDYWNE